MVVSQQRGMYIVNSAGNVSGKKLNAVNLFHDLTMKDRVSRVQTFTVTTTSKSRSKKLLTETKCPAC